MGNELLLKDEVYAVVGAAMEVHNVLSSGFAEAVYQEALEIELTSRGIRSTPRSFCALGTRASSSRRSIAPTSCYGQLIAEIKAQKLSGREEAQVVNYLRATGFRVGLLINFSDPVRLDLQRFVL